MADPKGSDLATVDVVVVSENGTSLRVQRADGRGWRRRYLPVSEIRSREDYGAVTLEGQPAILSLPRWLAETEGLMPQERDRDTADMFGGEG